MITSFGDKRPERLFRDAVVREFHSLRINEQWRIIFKWIDNNAQDVAIRDYH